MSSDVLGALWRGLRREVVVDRRAVAAIAVATVVSCMALAADVRFYTAWSPAPFTLQTFFVYLAGASLGPGLATAALGTYFVLGGIGLPIFTAGLFGPTTGYLLGFIVAARLIAALTQGAERRATVRLAAAMAVGGAVLLLCGSAYLWLLCGRNLSLALWSGAVVFLPGEAVKIAAAVAFCRAYRHRLGTLFPS